MSNSRPKPTAICILILEILLCIAVYLLCVCIRRRRCPHQHRWFHIRTTLVPLTNPPAPRGLDPAVVATFPVIPCTALSDHGRLELHCAVCFNIFQDEETLRFIPKCQHVFHPGCVDPWLALHTTCPFCRAGLAIPSGSDPTNSDRQASPSPGEVVNKEASSACTASPGPGGSRERYTLRLSDEIWRSIRPEYSNRSFVAGEKYPPMVLRGASDDYDGQPTV